MDVAPVTVAWETLLPSSSNEVETVSYVKFKIPDGRTLFGVGINADIVTASLCALVSAANRAAG